MLETFKLPIFYNDQKMELRENIVEDLELVNLRENTNDNIPMYHHLFSTSDNPSIPDLYVFETITNPIIKEVSKYYTTDAIFLKETQKILKKIPKNPKKFDYNEIYDIWREIKSDTDFKTKYNYIDWSPLEWLNKSDLFLQIMFLFNISSPILSLLVPFFLLIIPFAILKIKGIEINITEYCHILTQLFQSYAIGRLFTQYNEVNINEKIYLILSSAFYLFSIYQNIMFCIKVHKNMIKIHDYFEKLDEYLSHTQCSMQTYLKISEKYKSHTPFNECLREKMDTIKNIQTKISKISEYHIRNISKINEFGSVLTQFYELHTNEEYNEAIMYSFGFHGYMICMQGLANNKHIKKAKFLQRKKEGSKGLRSENVVSFKEQELQRKKEGSKGNVVSFKDIYYPMTNNDVIKNNVIKNNIVLDKNIIITGPNASGKTTILKSVLMNIIFTQQFGYGFYSSAELYPFKYLHCYLNIPDTSGRDSLFQAEARRCKEIIDCVNDNNKDTHFCLFDELYSGTNPEEATHSSVAFLKYIIKNKNIKCMLTTHFIDICKKMNNHKYIENCHMETNIINNNKLNYIYKLKKGISEVKGAVCVLSDLNYPKEILCSL
jgi:hypothetical protein